MALPFIVTDMAFHGGAGAAFSMLDYIIIRIAMPREKRMADKLACLRSVEAVLDVSAANGDPADTGSNSANPVKVNSLEYARHIFLVQDYLKNQGFVVPDLSLLKRLTAEMKRFLVHEKINNLTLLQKLGVGFALEAFYDLILEFHMEGIASVANDLYQIPCFFAGLIIGDLFKKICSLLMTSSEENETDETIAALFQQTKIVEIVMNYTPPEDILEKLSADGLNVYATRLSRTGQGVFKHVRILAASVKQTATDVMDYSEKMAEKERQETEEQQKRFDEITKGR